MAASSQPKSRAPIRPYDHGQIHPGLPRAGPFIGMWMHCHAKRYTMMRRLWAGRADVVGTMGFIVGAVLPPGIGSARAAAVRYERLGFEYLWTTETSSDPFTDLAIPAVETRGPVLGTNVAIAFARSPFVTAVNAWQLQRASRGRFVLGLGTQVKGHIERRFGMTWESPGPKLREYVSAVRALWASFQGVEPLEFRGRYYTHTLLTPPVDPGSSIFPPPKLMLAAFNPYNWETAGRLADGVLLHPLTSSAYLEHVAMPALARGLAVAGRTREDVTLVCPLILSSGLSSATQGEAEASVRRLISYYGATRTYRAAFELHGWTSLPEQLHPLMTTGDVKAMAALIRDEMVDTFAIRGEPSEVAHAVRARYGGVVDQVYISNLHSLDLERDDDVLEELRAALAQ